MTLPGLAKQIELWMIDRLIPWLTNPRTHSDDWLQHEPCWNVPFIMGGSDEGKFALSGKKGTLDGGGRSFRPLPQFQDRARLASFSGPVWRCGRFLDGLGLLPRLSFCRRNGARWAFLLAFGGSLAVLAGDAAVSSVIVAIIVGFLARRFRSHMNRSCLPEKQGDFVGRAVNRTGGGVTAMGEG